MRAIIVTICLSLCGACGLAAAEPAIPAASYPPLVKHAQSVEGFLPMEWRMEIKQSGDLNGDGRDDVAMVLRAIDERNIIDMRGQGGPEKYDTNPRILMVAFANAAGGYDLALENHTLIGRNVEPTAQDPLDPNGVQEGGVEIKKGTLQVTLGYFGGDMGHTTFTFRFQGGRFALIGYDSINVERSQGIMRSVSVNYATLRMERSIGKISDDVNKVTRTKLAAKPLLTMQQIGDGLDFRPTK
ncbi:MAG TPA: hypothetical protein VK522_20830 [Pseudolabrys sp.]|nr:hypothetical protein [Pseudolabrys sp.]